MIPDYPTAPHHSGSPSYSPPKIEGRQHVADGMWRIGMNVDWAYCRLAHAFEILEGKIDEQRLAAVIAAALDLWDATATDMERRLDEVSAAGHVTLSPVSVNPWRKWIGDYVDRTQSNRAGNINVVMRDANAARGLTHTLSPIDQTLAGLGRMESAASGNPEWPAVRDAVVACRAILAGLQSAQEDAE